MARLIEDYGLIGDGETAALVRRNGSIDWLCWPRFDSDACFASLLGTARNGYWRIAPKAQAKTSRRYIPDTLVLETESETPEGRIRVTDFMPVRSGASRLIRKVEGLEGECRIESELLLRFDYGSVTPWIDIVDDRVVARIGPDTIVLVSPASSRVEDGMVRTEATVRKGDVIFFTLAYGEADIGNADATACEEALSRTCDWWRDWIAPFHKATDWPEAVRRSLITLRAMIYRPSGGMVAAPTTSLPEAPGGERNWDYRYCWLRDSTFTLAALLNAGFHREACEWRDWLLRAVAGDPDKMRIMYRIDGSRRLEEWTVDWLPGFRWATPVRVGNAAAGQRQLDIYGEVMDVLHMGQAAGLPRLEQCAHVEDAIVDHVRKVWREPDSGFWESRGKPRHHVYSKVSIWVALDRYVKIRSDGDCDDIRRLRDSVHEEICREGFDGGLNTFVSFYGSHEVDGSLLLLPIVGFLPIDDPRIAGTIRAIEQTLFAQGHVHRRRPERENPEGAFIACTCWLAECQFMQGRRDDARATFEGVLSACNDLGLLAEEFDVSAGRLSGNFPQALSHLALVQTALTICGPVMRRGDG